jgi:hypothetical protein
MKKSVAMSCVAFALAFTAAAEAGELRRLEPGGYSALRDLDPTARRPAGSVERCGTRTPSLAERTMVETDVAPLLASAAAGIENAKPGAVRTVKVVFLVIHQGNNGLLSLEDLQNQIDVLNYSYAGMGVRFTLYDAYTAEEPDLFSFSLGSEAEYYAKTMLDDAGYDARRFLRIYTGLPVTDEGDELLGYATFPWWLSGEPETDGVVINWTSLPGGQAPYDEGDTTVHEVGHWLGLYHTFQGGCAGKGDEVGDTPAEAQAAYGCPVGRDTCRSKGKDAVFNFMNYTDDACLFQFSGGQRNRVKAFVGRYRNKL